MGRIDDELLENFSFAGKTIDFARLELRAGSADRSADPDGSGVPASLDPARRKSRATQIPASMRYGAFTRIPTRARSTISSSVSESMLKKIPSKPRHLLTVRGVGYRFVADPAGPQ